MWAWYACTNTPLHLFFMCCECAVATAPKTSILTPAHLFAWRLCMHSAVTREETVLLLNNLGDTNAEHHYNLFSAARYMLIAGVALLCLVMLITCCMCVRLPSRWLLCLPGPLLIVALVLTAVAPILWAIVHNRTFKQITGGFQPKLGAGWILAVCCAAATGLAMLAVLLATCRPDRRTRRKQERDIVKPTRATELTAASSATSVGATPVPGGVPTNGVHPGATAPSYPIAQPAGGPPTVPLTTNPPPQPSGAALAPPAGMPSTYATPAAGPVAV